jgi:hypothetical protein
MSFTVPLKAIMPWLPKGPESEKVETKGLEPSTPSLQSYNATDASLDNKALTSTPSAACTAACTSEDENANAGAFSIDQNSETDGINQDQGDPLAKLVAAIAILSPADRIRLAKLLIGER